MCIGGPKHGQRIALPYGGAHVQVVSPLDRYAVPVDEGRYAPLSMKTERYSVMKVKLGSGAVKFLAHESLGMQTAADAFLDVLAWEYERGENPR